MESLQYSAADVHDTWALAESLAPHLRPGDVVLLDGSLGSGKTAFVQALMRKLGYPEAVTSPTFTIANSYESPSLTVLHIDTYRLESAGEFRDLGLTDYLDDCCFVVEWGERVAAEFDEPLRVNITFGPAGETQRRFILSAESERWSAVLQQMRRGHLRLVAQ